jgi:SAM-dependent methyltransferase
MGFFRLMNPAEYASLDQSERDLWWFRGMRKVLFRLLDAFAGGGPITRVLEAGSGTGYTASLLAQRYGCRTFAIDLAWEAVARTPRRDGVYPVQADVAAFPFGKSSFDAVISLDVLVHLARGEESRALREFARVLRPGGLLVLRVAALDVLRSKHSEFVGERQRFTRQRLVNACCDAGFRVLRCTYVNSLLMPAALIRFRLWEPLSARPARSGTGFIPPWLNRLFYASLVIEDFLLSKGLNFPLGQTLILLGRLGTSRPTGGCVSARYSRAPVPTIPHFLPEES